MSFLRAVLVVCATTMAGVGAETLPTELLPPGTSVVVGFSLRALLDSPTLRGLFGNPAALSTALASSPFAGIDLMHDLDTVTIASTGSGQNAPSLIILQGRFHPGAKMERNGDDALAVIDERTAIAGKLAQVEAALRRKGHPAAVSPEVAARIGELSAAYEIWAFGDIPETPRRPGEQAQALDSVDRFEIGASLRSGLDLRGRLHLRSPEEAAKMAMTLKMFEGLFKAQAASASKTQFDLRAENGTIQITISIPEEELRKGIAAQKGMLAGMMQSRLQAAGMGVAAAQGSPTRAAIGWPIFAPPVGEPASRPAPGPAAVVTNDRGETVQLTLPGK
jgi:hypothetical protein